MCSHAGLFDKLNKAINSVDKTIGTTDSVIQTNSPDQNPPPVETKEISNAEPPKVILTNSPDLNTQPANPPAEEAKNVEPPKAKPLETAQPAQSSAAENSLPKVKAFNTLNFGDDEVTARKKLAQLFEISVDSVEESRIRRGIDSIEYDLAEDFGLLLKIDGENEAYQSNPKNDAQYYSSLREYFKRVGGSVEYKSFYVTNSTFSVFCLVFNVASSQGSGLAYVNVTYNSIGGQELAEKFKQNYPNAKSENKTLSDEQLVKGVSLPGGAFINFLHDDPDLNVYREHQAVVITDTTPERKATLIIPANGFQFILPSPANLSPQQQNIWEHIMHQTSDATRLEDFFDLMRSSLLKDERLNHPVQPTATFNSKQILQFHLNKFRNEYRESVEKQKQAADKAQKETEIQQNKEKEKATGF